LSAVADYGRYRDLVDRGLAERLATEDAAVEAGLSPFEQLTSPAHRRWLHQCIASPQHVSPVTGHRWCRDCACPVNVAVDDRVATRQILRACRASLATVCETRAMHVDQRRCA
jgi:hypothetical protein